MSHFFAPRHLRDVNESFNARLDFNKRTKIHELRNRARNALTRLVACRCRIPRLGLKLLKPERNRLCLGIDLENADLKFLPNRQHVFRLADAAPGYVTYMKEAVDSAEIDECTIGRETAHGTAERVPRLHRGIATLLQRARLLFKHNASINHDILVRDIEFGDAAGYFGIDEFFQFGRIPRTAAAGGHKGAHADINVEASLDDAGDSSHNGEFLGKSLFKRGPVAGLCNLEA